MSHPKRPLTCKRIKTLSGIYPACLLRLGGLNFHISLYIVFFFAPPSTPPLSPSLSSCPLCCLRQHNTAKHTHTKPNKPLSHSPSMSSTRFPLLPLPHPCHRHSFPLPHPCHKSLLPTHARHDRNQATIDVHCHIFGVNSILILPSDSLLFR